MRGKVIKFYPKDAANKPDSVLEQAIGVYESVLIIGFDKRGELNSRGSLNVDQYNALMLMELLKRQLVEQEHTKTLGDNE